MATRTTLLEISEDYLVTAKKIREFGDFLESSAVLVNSANKVMANQVKVAGMNLLMLYVRINDLAGHVHDGVDRLADLE